MDLRVLFHDEDPLSPRYVLALVLHLPRDGAFYADRRGGQQYRGWDEDRYALASLVNEMRVNNHLFTLANRDPKKAAPKPPPPFPTPEQQERKSSAPAPGSFAAIAASMMAAQRKKRELLYGK